VSEHAIVVRILSGRARAGSAEQFLAAVRPAVEWLTAQEGCFGAQLCRQKEDPATLAVISRWRDEAALDAALSSEEYRPQIQPVFEFVEGEPLIVHYRSVEPA
jgi:quinol monooxygenase YgiN